MNDLLNNDFYNTFYETFDKIPFEEHLPKIIQKYCPPKSRILEIGSGAGALALWMVQQGYSITCIEPAEKAAAKALERGLKVEVIRWQDFQLKEKYDAILAISSLIHIARDEIDQQIEKIADALKEDGHAIITFIEGEGEVYEDPTEKGKERFFAKYTLDEMQKMLKSFTIVESHRLPVKKVGNFSLFVLRKC